MTRSARLTIAVVALTYGALWGLTAVAGVPRIRDAGIAIVTEHTNYNKREPLGITAPRT